MLATTNSLTIDNTVVALVGGALFTIAGLLIVAFITFFLRRLVDQLDKVSNRLDRQAEDIAVLKSQFESFQNKTQVVTVTKDVTHHQTSESCSDDS